MFGERPVHGEGSTHLRMTCGPFSRTLADVKKREFQAQAPAVKPLI